MIIWDGEEMHDASALRCWGDRSGEECGGPVTTPVGLCAECLVRLRGGR